MQWNPPHFFFLCNSLKFKLKNNKIPKKNNVISLYQTLLLSKNVTIRENFRVQQFFQPSIFENFSKFFFSSERWTNQSVRILCRFQNSCMPLVNRRSQAMRAVLKNPVVEDLLKPFKKFFNDIIKHFITIKHISRAIY